MYQADPPERRTSRMSALAGGAHLTMAVLHAQGVVFHLTDEEERSPLCAGVHAAAALFSGVSFLRHWQDGRQ